MIDCNNVENFFHEYQRMCDGINCEDCELSNSISCCDCKFVSYNNPKSIICSEYVKKFPKEAIAIVQVWSDEHPPKTFLRDFLEKHPKAPLASCGLPEVCAKEVGYGAKTCSAAVSCKDCWNTPLTEDNE